MDVVIIHGYSDKVENMKAGLGQRLKRLNTRMGNPIPDLRLRYADYTSLDDQACFEDLAEGLFLELRKLGLLDRDPRTLHFVVHSTGGLVLRQMLMQYAWMDLQRIVGNVVMLAPANHGSPLAHKAKSLLGRLAKGNRSNTADFMEVGERITEGLEMASPKQWELANYDLFAPEGTIFTPDGVRAYVITGSKPYGGLRSFISEDGTDGTIVVAGAGLNCRKYVLDFVHTRIHGAAGSADWEADGALPETHFATHGGVDHSTVLEDEDVLRLVVDSLAVKDAAGYEALAPRYETFSVEHPGEEPVYQQFYFRVTDDKGMSVDDYHLQFNVWKRSNIGTDANGWLVAKRKTESMSKEEQQLSGVLDRMLRTNAHVHSRACHYRRFLVVPAAVRSLLGNDFVITISILAQSGDDQIGYATQAFENLLVHDPVHPGAISLFFGNTTTFVDIHIDRFSSLMRVVG